MRNLSIFVVSAIVTFGGIAAVSYAQVVPGTHLHCRSDSLCTGQECILIQGGPINNCNCCPAYNGIWKCCPNVACPDCDLGGGTE